MIVTQLRIVVNKKKEGTYCTYQHAYAFLVSCEVILLHNSIICRKF